MAGRRPCPSWLGGWLLDHTDRRGLFTAMMLTCLVALGVFVVGWRRGRSKPTIGY